MTGSVPLEVLIAPLVIAVTAVASMIVLTGARTPRRVSSELGYQPDPDRSLSLSAARYVGGHPDGREPFSTPFLLLTPEHLAVFARRGGALRFKLPWERIDMVVALTREEAGRASLTVRGLAAGALEAAPDEARFLRVRFSDDNDWWQNMLIELDPAHAEAQAGETIAYWERQRGAKPEVV